MLIGIWIFLGLVGFIFIRIVYSVSLNKGYSRFAEWIDVFNQHLSALPYLLIFLLGGLVMAIVSGILTYKIFNKMLTRYMEE
jgi:hypothetical protein